MSLILFSSWIQKPLRLFLRLNLSSRDMSSFFKSIAILIPLPYFIPNVYGGIENYGDNDDGKQKFHLIVLSFSPANFKSP